MPFVSEAQRRWMYARHPAMAKRWSEHTPKGAKLPQHVGDTSKPKPHTDAVAVDAESKLASLFETGPELANPLWRIALTKLANNLMPQPVQPVGPPVATLPPSTGQIVHPMVAAQQQRPQASNPHGGPSMNPIQSFGALSTTGEVNGNAGLGVQHSLVPHKLAATWLGLRV